MTSRSRMGSGGLAQLAASWRIQRRVIGALLMREVLTRYGRHNIGFLWLFAEPMSFTLGISALWTLAGMAHSTHIPIVAFAVTGYSAVLLWRNMPSRCIGAIPPNLALMYHRNVRVLDIFISRIVLEALGATVSFITLSAIFISLGLMAPPEDVLLVVEGWLLLGWFGSSFALFLGALAERSELVDKLWHPISYIIMPLSGIAFIVDAVPERLQNLLLWFPMSHGTEIIRAGFFGSLFTPHYDMTYIATVSLLFTFLALNEVSGLSKRVVPE